MVTALAAVKSQRLLPFYAVAWFCYLPGALAITPIGTAACRLWCRQTRLLFAVWGIIAIVMGSLAWSLGPWRLVVPGQPLQGVGSTMYYPVGGVEYLRKHQFRGNLMTSHDGWESVLEKYPTDAICRIDEHCMVNDGFSEVFMVRPVQWGLHRLQQSHD